MSKFKHHKKIDLFQSKQNVFFRKLWESLQQRGWRIKEEVVDIGNEILRMGDVPGDVLVNWELVRSARYQPLYLDFVAGNDWQQGSLVTLNDFWSCNLRGQAGREWSLYKDDTIDDILKTLDEMEDGCESWPKALP